MNRIMRTACVLALAMLASVAWAQQPAVDHLSQSDLLQKAQQLEQQAQSTGLATATLNEYPNHLTMISLRTKSGAAETHQNYADFFFVVSGKAVLVTGGAVPDQKTVSPGEFRGTSIDGGARVSLQKGDIVHIPVRVPHQLLLAGHANFVYYVIKVRQD